MSLSYFVVAAAAAAQAAAPQPSATDLAQARAQGYAQAQQALAGSSAPTTQSVVAPAAPQAALLAPAAGPVLRAGAEVPLKLEEALDSNNKSVREGEQFRMVVADDVRLGNMVVIPAGSPATGEVTDLRRKGMWGKSGHVSARVLSVRVGDRLIRLSGTFDEHGTTGTAGVVAAIAFVPIAGFFMTGTSAKIPAGAGVKAFLDEDVAVALPTAAPIVVPAAASAAVSAAPAAGAHR